MVQSSNTHTPIGARPVEFSLHSISPTPQWRSATSHLPNSFLEKCLHYLGRKSISVFTTVFDFRVTPGPVLALGSCGVAFDAAYIIDSGKFIIEDREACLVFQDLWKLGICGWEVEWVDYVASTSYLSHVRWVRCVFHCVLLEIFQLAILFSLIYSVLCLSRKCFITLNDAMAFSATISSPPDCEYSLLREFIFVGSEAPLSPVLLKWFGGCPVADGEPEEYRQLYCIRGRKEHARREERVSCNGLIRDMFDLIWIATEYKKIREVRAKKQCEGSVQRILYRRPNWSIVPNWVWRKCHRFWLASTSSKAKGELFHLDCCLHYWHKWGIYRSFKMPLWLWCPYSSQHG